MAEINRATFQNAPKSGQVVLKDSVFQRSVSSPRVNGKLKLQPNPWLLQKRSVFGMVQGGNSKDYSYYPVPGMGNAMYSSTVISARNAALLKARNRFRAKLYKGSAALGVTIASYRQSREMIVNRATNIADSAKLLLGRMNRDSSLLRHHSAAGSYLETVFGWQPLLADIHASCMTVIQQADYLDWVRGRRTEQFLGEDWFNSDSPDRFFGMATVSISAQVRIKNPNLWLLERAGLINPMAVAWDLVPWSFVVNMFVSTGALVNSITDFMGLEFREESTTYATRGIGNRYVTNGLQRVHPHFAWAMNGYTFKDASRVVGPIPRPPLMLKLPKADWSLAAIAASLMVQRVKALDRFFSLTPVYRPKRRRR